MKQAISSLNLPLLQNRDQMLLAFSKHEYGVTPAPPEAVMARVLEEDANALAGKARLQRLILSFDTPNGQCSFPFTLIAPKGAGLHPAIVYLAFRDAIPDEYLPSEDILDQGFALAVLHHEAVTSDSEQMDGLAALYDINPGTGWGKIGMWGFAASRVLDYLLTLNEIDPNRMAISGHSRLGKTALWCGAQDERFSLVISNQSGCGGAALHRGKQGEMVANITAVFPFWFCEDFKQYAGKEDDLPFDQHWLLASIAPRAVYVSSAMEDAWADLRGEYLACVAASGAWGQNMNSTQEEQTIPPDAALLAGGKLGYHCRPGGHAHSREDWLKQLAFFKRQFSE